MNNPDAQTLIQQWEYYIKNRESLDHRRQEAAVSAWGDVVIAISRAPVTVALEAIIGILGNTREADVPWVIDSLISDLFAVREEADIRNAFDAMPSDRGKRLFREIAEF